MRLNKNAHCFAVEPSGWRFTFDASIFVTLFRRFAPSDSPRVHQWHSDKIAMPQLCLPFGKYNITLAQAKISPPTAISFALSEFHSFNLLCNTKHSFLCGFPSGRLPRVVCFALDQSIVASDKCLSYAFILLFPKSTKVSFGDPFFARNDIFLSATCTLLLFFRQGKTVRNTDGFLLFGFIVFC